jgi:hypothetical protein
MMTGDGKLGYLKRIRVVDIPPLSLFIFLLFLRPNFLSIATRNRDIVTEKLVSLHLTSVHIYFLPTSNGVQSYGLCVPLMPSPMLRLKLFSIAAASSPIRTTLRLTASAFRVNWARSKTFVWNLRNEILKKLRLLACLSVRI